MKAYSNFINNTRQGLSHSLYSGENKKIERAANFAAKLAMPLVLPVAGVVKAGEVVAKTAIGVANVHYNALASIPGAVASIPGAVASIPGAVASIPGAVASARSNVYNAFKHALTRKERIRLHPLIVLINLKKTPNDQTPNDVLVSGHFLTSNGFPVQDFYNMLGLKNHKDERFFKVDQEGNVPVYDCLISEQEELLLRVSCKAYNKVKEHIKVNGSRSNSTDLIALYVEFKEKDVPILSYLFPSPFRREDKFQSIYDMLGLVNEDETDEDETDGKNNTTIYNETHHFREIPDILSAMISIDEETAKKYGEEIIWNTLFGRLKSTDSESSGFVVSPTIKPRGGRRRSARRRMTTTRSRRRTRITRR